MKPTNAKEEILLRLGSNQKPSGCETRLYNSRTRYQLRHRGYALLDVQVENTLYVRLIDHPPGVEIEHPQSCKEALDTEKIVGDTQKSSS
jgi:hypothetical protein